MDRPSEPSERTPLIQADPPEPRSGDLVSTDDIQASGVVGEGALEVPQNLPSRGEPSIGNGVGYSENGRIKQDDLHAFGDHGILVGITKWRFRFIFGGILTSYFIAVFDSTLMASSHPVITSYFNASNSASWLSTAFLLTSTSLQPLFGRVSDTVGRRILYLFGLLFLALTTAWCALAQSIESFIAARAFSGLGAAAVLSMATIMTNDLVSIQVRGTYQAYINLFFGGGSVAGAAFGGFLCDRLGWRMTFAIQVPALLCLCINAYLTTPADLGPNLAKRAGLGLRHAMKGFDFAGCFLLTGTVAFLILGLNLGGNIYPWKHPVVITSLVVAFIAGAALVRVESRAARPVMPLNILLSKPRGYMVFNNFFANIGINSIIFNAPLFFQAVKLESASVSGFRLTGPAIALTTAGVSSGFIMTATGRMQWLIVAGSLSMLVGSVGLSIIRNNVPTWLATVLLIPPSLGQGLAFPAVSVAVLATSKQEDQAVMTSMVLLWRSLGMVMGVSLSSLILQNALKAHLECLVTGQHKNEIILMVRRSVRSIIDLGPKHQGEVIEAYERSLRTTFISTVALFVIANALIATIRLPNLKRKEVQGREEEQA